MRPASARHAAQDPAAAPAGAPAEPRALAAIVFVSAAIALVVFARQLFLGDPLALRDFLPYTWPARQALVEGLRAGRLPEWNDWIGLGTAFAAMPTNGVTYPPQWLAAAFPLPFGIHLVMALHLFAAGVGTGLLSRRLGASALGGALAAAALMTSGYVASNAVNGTFQSIAWVPWVAWAADRLAALDVGRALLPVRSLRPMAVLAAVIACQILSGDPSSVVTAGLLAVAVTLARSTGRGRAVARLAVAAAFALPLSAMSVLPSAALLGSTSRALGFGEVEWSMHPWRLVELFWPGALGDPIAPAANLARAIASTALDRPEPSWAYSVFVGGPVLALAVLGASAARGSRALLLTSALIVALALGAYSPLYHGYRAVFPLEKVLRYPEKYLVGAVVLWCALAGAGVTRLRERSRGLRARFVLAACLPVGVAVAVSFALAPALLGPLGAAASAAQPAPGVDLGRALPLMLSSGVTAFVVATVAAALLAAPRAWMAVAGVAILTAHGTYLGWRVSPVVDAAALRTAPALLAAVAPAGDDGIRPRVLRPPNAIDLATLRAGPAGEALAAWRYETLVSNTAARFGFAVFPGAEGFRSKTFEVLWFFAQRSASTPLEGLASLYAIEYLALPGADAARASLPVVGTSERGWRLLAVPRPRPRAFVAQRWRSAPISDVLEASLARGRHLDPGLVMITAPAGADLPLAPEAAPLVPCAVLAPTPEDVRLDCASPYGGYAVLADEHMPGWTARVDGAPAEIARADLLLRAVRIGPGRHSIEFRYRTPLLRAGIAISALAWVAILFVLTRRRPVAGG